VKESILYIGGDPAAQNLLGETFSREEFHVFTAPPGGSIPFHLSFAQPNLIIVDIDPHSAGRWETLRRIRERSSAPVIVLTDQEGAGIAIEALNWGADECLAKSVDGRELRARARALVRRTRPVSPAARQSALASA
jgi:DNA-binding response OmpR family regulator